MTRLEDYSNILGKNYGNLTVISDEGRILRGKHFRHCLLVECSCGRRKVVVAYHVITNKIKSCGCRKNDNTPTRIKHGLSDTPIHRTWSRMRERCYNPNNKQYMRYGGRGIKVCDRWLESFENFLGDMGHRPESGTEKYSLGRIDNNGDYTPENCRWETAEQQANNTRTNLYVTYRGKTQSVKQWCRDLELPYTSIIQRFQSGWDAETAFTTPVSYQNIAYEVGGLRKALTITFKGQTKTIREWASEYGLSSAVLRTRYVHLKWPVDESLFRSARPRTELKPRKRKGPRK